MHTITRHKYPVLHPQLFHILIPPDVQERSQSPTQVLLVVYNDSLEIWSDGPEFQELAKLGLLQVVHTGAVEGRFTKDFCIVHRHRVRLALVVWCMSSAICVVEAWAACLL